MNDPLLDSPPPASTLHKYPLKQTGYDAVAVEEPQEMTYPPPPNNLESHHLLLEEEGDDEPAGIETDHTRQISLASLPPTSALPPHLAQTRPLHLSSTDLSSPVHHDSYPSSSAGSILVRPNSPFSLSPQPPPPPATVAILSPPTTLSSISSSRTPRQMRSNSSSKSSWSRDSSFVRDSRYPTPPPQQQHTHWISTEETRVLAEAQQQQQRRSTIDGGATVTPVRTSVILYRLDDTRQDSLSPSPVSRLDDSKARDMEEALVPPSLPFGGGAGGGREGRRHPSTGTMTSTASRQSYMSGDSRVPLVSGMGLGGVNPSTGSQFVAYAYQLDALLDGEEDDEDDDWLHDPRVPFFASSDTRKSKGKGKEEDKEKGLSVDPSRTSGYVEQAISWRGLVNYVSIWLLLAGLVALFIFYPVVDQTLHRGMADIANNPSINSTGQAID
ncbi:hypothetical protein D9757_005875 [Collybiopsis confluens]|uniref:Uncharacterized protein n=1 Tax=Collybiopsis confluens TaxID=2823264 RepID=A0A8H5HN51_9AGAR|nr:hypothetical protein D9757_005875 [Collybiopsis confluens]